MTRPSHHGIALSDDGRIFAVGLSASGELVFHWDGSKWVEMGDDSKKARGWFGYAISLSSYGDILAVGIPTFLVGGRGQAQIYSWVENAKTQKGASIIETTDDDRGLRQSSHF